jgi:hypothetical protein
VAVAQVTEHPVWTAVGGTALGALCAAVLWVAGLLPTAAHTAALPHMAVAGGEAAAAALAPPHPAPPHPAPPQPAPPAPASRALAEEFLAAWRAHLMASWSVDEVTERTTTAGATVRFDVHEAQAPPDSVLIGNGTVAARRGAVQLACGPGGTGRGLTCRSAPAPLSWQRDADRRVAALRAEMEGPGAVYRVQQGAPGCWVLVLSSATHVVPVALGRAATFCLDPATGALRSSEVHRVGAVDRVVVVSTHAPATAADLALPPGASIA